MGAMGRFVGAAELFNLQLALKGGGKAPKVRAGSGLNDSRQVPKGAEMAVQKGTLSNRSRISRNV